LGTIADNPLNPQVLVSSTFFADSEVIEVFTFKIFSSRLLAVTITSSSCFDLKNLVPQ
jgi:hypothetical protein